MASKISRQELQRRKRIAQGAWASQPFLYPTPEEISELEQMLNELRTNHLEVGFLPLDFGLHRGEKIQRYAAEENVDWYKTLCRCYPRPNQSRWRRKPRTSIKRQYIIKMLQRMIKHGRSRSKYAEFLLGEAQERLAPPELDEEDLQDFFNTALFWGWIQIPNEPPGAEYDNNYRRKE